MTCAHIIICVIVLSGSYLLGSISFAIISSKIFKLPDPRGYGSKNAGATNMMRSGNKMAGVVTFLGDYLKGIVLAPIFYMLIHIAHINCCIELMEILASIGIMLGHIFPIYFNFKGGKGVATGLGIISGLYPIIAAIAIIAWVVVFKLTKTSSLGALSAFFVAIISAICLDSNSMHIVNIAIIAIVIFVTHRGNLVRLFKKQELNF